MKISIVIPVHNEGENIEALSDEICQQLDVRCDFELIIIDDGSTDNSRVILKDLAHKIPMLRVIYHKQKYGQSSALFTGVSNAVNNVIVTMDGDGQNDPGEIEKLLKIYQLQNSVKTLIAGHRRIRQDGAWKKISSRLANAVRSLLLSDETPDTGCGLKVFSRELFLSLPAFDHMHRFLPALVKRAGGEVISVEITHQPRRFGRSHYGTIDRLVTGIIDLIGVIWLLKRPINPKTERVGF